MLSVNIAPILIDTCSFSAFSRLMFGPLVRNGSIVRFEAMPRTGSDRVFTGRFAEVGLL